MSKQDGGPAFPVSMAANMQDLEGMTLRDYFAGQAMQANLIVIREFPDETWRMGLALDAYEMADAMLLAARAKP